MGRAFVAAGKKKRNSNIELLRIIAMFLIVMHHYSIHGFDTSALQEMPDRLVVDWFMAGGKVGVVIFVLISAYFMVN